MIYIRYLYILTGRMYFFNPVNLLSFAMFCRFFFSFCHWWSSSSRPLFTTSISYHFSILHVYTYMYMHNINFYVHIIIINLTINAHKEREFQFWWCHISLFAPVLWFWAYCFILLLLWIFLFCFIRFRRRSNDDFIFRGLVALIVLTILSLFSILNLIFCLILLARANFKSNRKFNDPFFCAGERVFLYWPRHLSNRRFATLYDTLR